MIRWAEARARRIDHHKQLEQVIVHRRRARLDDEHVRSPDRLAVPAVHLAVRERLELDQAELETEPTRDSGGEPRIRAPGEDHKRAGRPTPQSVQAKTAPGAASSCARRRRTDSSSHLREPLPARSCDEVCVHVGTPLSP
jgi:hypothetical protein